ncbi:MAG TPA: TolC family protein [bacterium]|nr:TolC family protein [bacterium]
MRTLLSAILILLVGLPVGVRAQTPQAVTLESAMVSAVDRHPTVVAATQALRAAEARVVAARAGTAVAISANARASVGTVGTSGAPTGGDAGTSHDVSVGATYPLYDGGITALQIVQAQAAVESAQASLAAARQDVALAAGQAYFNVLRAQRTVEVREAALRTARGQVEQAEAFVRAGTGARADVIRAQATAATAEADLVGARGQVEITMVQLRSAMALPVAQAVTVADPAAPVPVVLAPSDAAAQAVRERPEVRRLDADVRSAEVALRIAEIRAGFLITVSAGGVVQVSPNPGRVGWSVGANASFPILDGGAARAEVAAARANVAAAQARREATVLQVQTQAYQAAAGARDTNARVEALRVSVNAADESLRVAEGRYRAGVGTLFEVLDAQTLATQARINAVQALYDLHLAIVNLQYALGQPLVRRT